MAARRAATSARDLGGRVVGINTAIVERARGIGFAIPVNLIKAELGQLRARGRVVRGFLGVRVQHVSPLLARAFTLPRTGGALVSAVDPRGAAERAGVLPGDVVLSVDGKAVPTSDRLAEMVAAHEPGTPVRLGLMRRGRFLQLGAVVQSLPEEPDEAEASDGNGRPGASDRQRGPRPRHPGVSRRRASRIPRMSGAWRTVYRGPCAAIACFFRLRSSSPPSSSAVATPRTPAAPSTRG